MEVVTSCPTFQHMFFIESLNWTSVALIKDLPYDHGVPLDIITLIIHY